MTMLNMARRRWMSLLGFSTVAVFGFLGLTPYSTGSFAQSGVIGAVVSISFVLLGLGGIDSVMRGSLVTETFVLKVTGTLFGLTGVGAIVYLLDDGFQQWQGVAAYFVLACAMWARAFTFDHLLGARDGGI